MKELLQLKCIGRLLCTLFICVVSTHGAFAQKYYVNGTVLDGSGKPIAGVVISDKNNPSVAVSSDNAGLFSINVDGQATLVTSLLGYSIQEVLVGGRTNLRIVLSADAQLIDDVVVIGYGTVSRKDLTGAVSSVGQSILGDKPVNSLGQALQGRAAGVLVIDNGNPHENVTLKIRGLGTINNSDPLYVIDGVPSSLGMNSININDIETIDILKDASATAIYGSQGANGVVIITTKKGKIGEGVIKVSANIGISQPTNLPDFLNATQYATLNNEILTAGGAATNPAWADPSTLGKGTDWIDLMFNTGFRQNYSVSWSGGTEKSKYYISGGFTDDEGVLKSIRYNRLTLQLNGENQVKKWLKLGTNVLLSYDKKTQGSFGLSEIFNSLPTQPMYQADGSYDGPAGNPLWTGGTRNQYGLSQVNKNKVEGYNLLGSVFAEISIYDGLKFKSLASVEAKMSYTSNHTPKYAWKPIEVPLTEAHKGSGRFFTYLWDNYFSYDKKFGDHTVSGMLGSSLQWGVNDWFNGTKVGFLKTEIHQLDNGTTIKSLNGNGSEWAIASFMVRGHYSYKDKYMITATVRRDGSSRFGESNRWGTFPSFSAAWRLSEEGWYDTDWFVSSIKLRAGYGVTGHQNIDNYGFFSAYNTSVYSFNGNVVNSLVTQVMPNPNVHWEEVKQANIGVDLGLYKNKIRVTLDVYDKNTTGMLVPMAVPVSTGYSDITVPFVNAGKVNNKGLEANISADIFNKKNFSWTADFNISFNKNKIKSLNNDIPIYQNNIVNYGAMTVQAEGHPINAFYGYIAAGLFQTQSDVDNWASQVKGGTAPGDVRFLDLDNNGVINDYDRSYIGDPNPDFTFALNNNLRYRDFDLGFFFQGVYGNDVFNANRIFQEGMSAAQNQYATVLNRWTGPQTSNSMPRAMLSDPNKNTRVSSRFVEDGSYLRLKNLTLGYTLPKRISEKIYLQGVRVYASCQNLFTISDYSGIDPEVGLNGIDHGKYPVVRTFSFGIDLTF